MMTMYDYDDTDDPDTTVSLPEAPFWYHVRKDTDTVMVIHDDGMQAWPADAFKSALDAKATPSRARPNP